MPAILYLVVFCAFFDTHAQMPVLAPYAASLGATPFWLGAVVGSYSLFNIAGNFAGGVTIDRRSWKAPLILGLLGVTVFLLLYPQAGSAPGLAAIRAGHGLLGGILVPSALASLIAAGREHQVHGKRIALFGAAVGLAAVSGPLFAGIVAGRFGYPAVYYSLAALIFTAAVLACSVLRKVNTGVNPGAVESKYRQISLKEIALVPPIKSALIFAFGLMGSTGTLASFLPTRAAAAGLGAPGTGALFAIFALAAIAAQAAWPRFLRPLLGGSSTGGVSGLVLLSLALASASFLTAPAPLFPALAAYGIGFGLSFQGMLGLIVESSAERWRGRAIGLFFAVYSLGAALIPPLGGLIWQNLPLIFPFYTAATLALLCAAVGFKVLPVRKTAAR